MYEITYLKGGDFLVVGLHHTLGVQESLLIKEEPIDPVDLVFERRGGLTTGRQWGAIGHQ
jgi:hypothetical protein